MGQPAVIGEILAGVLLGPTLLGAHLAGTLFPAEVRPLLSALAGVGLALFMFAVGLEIDLGVLRGGGRGTLWATAFSTLLPLALGAALAWLLADSHRRGPLPAFVLFFAVAMAATAFPVLARIIADRGLTHTRIGTTALTCAAITDLLVWILLAVAAAVATGKHLDWRLVLLVPYVALMITVVRPLLRKASELSRRKKALSSKLDRDPTVKELAAHLDLGEEEVIESSPAPWTPPARTSGPTPTSWASVTPPWRPSRTCTRSPAAGAARRP